MVTLERGRMNPDDVVLITGCSSGIGKALALEFARRGLRVMATARRQADLEDLGTRTNIITTQLDVVDPESIARAVQETIASLGRIDMLINNAGFNLIGPLAETAPADVRRLLDTNVTGVLAVAQPAIAHMAKRESGTIVNISSMVAVMPTPFEGAYAASKAAVHIMSETLRIELAPFGIRVVEVQPGMVHSEIGNKAAGDPARYSSPDSLYAKFAHAIAHRRGSFRGNRTDAGEFARRLVAKLVTTRPPRLIRLGRGAQLFPFAMAVVPASLRDWVLRRMFGLNR